MTTDKYEFVHLPQFQRGMRDITMLPDKTGLAVFEARVLVHFSYDYTERPNLPMQELHRYAFEQDVMTYFAVSECNFAMVLAGDKLFTINMHSWTIYLAFENVSALSPHHPGYEAVLVSLAVQYQAYTSKAPIDLRYASMHLTQQGFNYACAWQHVPRVQRGVSGYGLFDFLIVMDGLAFVIYAYAEEQAAAPCVAYGPDGLQLAFFDSDYRASSFNASHIKFEYFVDLSNMAYFATEDGRRYKIAIENPLWVGDFVYYYALRKYYALDLRRLALANAAKQLEQEAPIFDVTEYSTPIIESATARGLKISLIGPEAATPELGTAVIAELLSRVRAGIAIDLRDPRQNGASGLYYMQELAHSQLYRFRAQEHGLSVASIVGNSLFYEPLRDIYPARPITGEGEKFVKAENVYRQAYSILGAAGAQQTPYILVSRPVQLSFHLDDCFYGLLTPNFKAAAVTSGKSSAFEQICDQRYYACQQQYDVAFPSGVEEIVKMPISLAAAAASVHNVLVYGYNAQVSCFGVRNSDGVFKLQAVKETKRLFEELRQHILHVKHFDSIYINGKRDQLLYLYTNDLDRSEILIILAMMHYALGNYQYCVNFLLEAPLVNPVSVVKLFMTNMHMAAFCTYQHKFRRDAPSVPYVKRCQNFGVFSDQVNHYLSDEHWQFLSDTYNKNDEDRYGDITLLEWRGQQETPYESNYSLFRGYNADFITFIWPWIEKLDNKERLLDIPETVEVSLYKLNDMPNYQLDTFKDVAAQHVVHLAYYLRCYLDSKMNFKQYMAQALKRGNKALDSEIKQRMISGNAQLQARLDKNPRNDAQNIIFLRTIFVILLSAAPFNVEEGFLFNLFFLRPEEYEAYNLKAIRAMLVSTQKQHIENALGLLALTRRYRDAGHLAAFAKNSVFTSQTDIQQFKYTCCLFYSFCTHDGATSISGELEQLSLDDPEQKRIYWDFVAHVCKFDVTSAVQLLSRKYKFMKKQQQQVQEIIFDKLTIKFSSSLKNYMKPPKDDLIAELAQMFTSRFLADFLAHIRFNDLENKKDKASAEYQDEYVKQRAYVMVFLFIVSKCVYLCHAEYTENKYNRAAPDWKSYILASWLSSDTAEFLNTYLPLYNDEDDVTQMSFFTSVARHLYPAISSLRDALYAISYPDAYKRDEELSSEILEQKTPRHAAKRLTEQQCELETQEISNAIGHIIVPYYLCLVKSGNVDQAVQLQFVSVFEQANFYKFFAHVLRMKQYRLISDTFANYSQEQLKPYLLKINPDGLRFTLNVQRFEQMLDNFVQFSRAIIVSICREKGYASEMVERIIDQDNIQYCQQVQLKSAACRSQVLLLHELMKCCNLAFQAEFIDAKAYELIINRLTLPGSKTAYILARYAPQRFLRLMYRKLTCRQAIRFLKDSFNENAEKQRELSMDIACELENTQSLTYELRKCYEASVALTARSKCENCGGLLLRTTFGAFRTQEGENGFVLVHTDCAK